MKFKAFTLAELLIALAVLGVIATFTVPKVLVVHKNQQYNAIAKETAAMISGAYQAYLADNTLTTTTGINNLTPYMNYVSIDTSGTKTIDMVNWSSGVLTCSSTNPCLNLHNGAVIYHDKTRFGGTGSSNMLYFVMDPDGKVTQPGGAAYGQGKSVEFFLYTTGRIINYGSCDAGTTSAFWASPSCPNSSPSPDPSWFNWN